MPSIGLNKIFSAIKTSYIPALILAVAVWFSCVVSTFMPEQEAVGYYWIYVFAGCSLLFLFFTNQAKMFFPMLWLLGVALVLNKITFNDGAGLSLNFTFVSIMFLMPLNMLWFVFVSMQNLRDKHCFYVLCLILLQACMIEQCSALDIVLPNLLPYYVACVVWVLAIVFFMAQVVQMASISQTAYFYAQIAMFCGFLTEKSGDTLAVFFPVAAFILLWGMVSEYVYGLFRDNLTGVYSGKSYYWHAVRSFPLKYSLGIVCIDNYDKVYSVFGKTKTDNLILMIVDKLKTLGEKAQIYRFASDEFILIFQNEDKKQGYEYLESVRRSIAGTAFRISRNQSIKVTVSAGISEKKRSDANADVVLQRTREAVQKAYKFTQNITSKA